MKELIDRLRGNAGNLEPFASIMKNAAEALESQAREIERLRRSAQANWNDFAEGMKAQPSGVVLTSLIGALKFYANGDHLLLADPDAWDTCSGEPFNFLHDDAGTASVEDGSIAKGALQRLNQPAIAGDERAEDVLITAIERIQSEVHQYLKDRHRPVTAHIERICISALAAPCVKQARAALSANHSEQVREMVTGSCFTCNGVGIVGHSILCPECAAPSAGSQKEQGE